MVQSPLRLFAVCVAAAGCAEDAAPLLIEEAPPQAGTWPCGVVRIAEVGMLAARKEPVVLDQVQLLADRDVRLVSASTYVASRKVEDPSRAKRPAARTTVAPKSDPDTRTHLVIRMEVPCPIVRRPGEPVPQYRAHGVRLAYRDSSGKRYQAVIDADVEMRVLPERLRD